MRIRPFKVRAVEYGLLNIVTVWRNEASNVHDSGTAILLKELVHELNERKEVFEERKEYQRVAMLNDLLFLCRDLEKEVKK